MRRVGMTDVWYLTVRMPRGARFIYRVSLNSQLDPDFLGDLELGSTAQADPLNPNQWLGHWRSNCLVHHRSPGLRENRAHLRGRSNTIESPARF